MRKDKVYYTCDQCADEIQNGFYVGGKIALIVKGECRDVMVFSGEPLEAESSDDLHFCKPCFKEILGMREGRVSKSTGPEQSEP